MTEFKDQSAFLRSVARESYQELVDFAAGQISQAKGGDAGLAAATLVSEITSEVAAETAAETAAEAVAQMADSRKA
jgi:hypothetical protein